MVRAALITAVSACVLAACGEPGTAPRMAVIDDETIRRTPVHQLNNLDDPYLDLFIAAERGLYIESGRMAETVSCEREGYLCLAWPFAFSFPLEGAPSMAGWQAGGFEFAARFEARRQFCGREVEAWMIEASNDAGASTHTWYDPEFGIYAVLVGQAEDGRMVRIERAYSTCERGLFARDGVRRLAETQD